jgi:hypothetical protein
MVAHAELTRCAATWKQIAAVDVLVAKVKGGAAP